MAEHYPTVPQTAPDLATTLETFRNWLSAHKGLAASTIDNHTSAVRRAAAKMGLAPNQTEIYRYIAELRNAGSSYAHIVNASAAIEHYMDYLGTPLRLGRPRKPKPLLKPTLSEAEISILLAHCETLRDKALLALLAYSGIRNAELCALRVEDVDLGAGLVHVRIGKGQRAYAACIAGACIDLVAGYVRDRRAAPDELLFTTARKGLPLEPQDLRKLVRRAARRAGIAKRVHPHLFRHSLAMNMVNRGAHLFTVQHQLGHAYPDTTLIYLRSNFSRSRSEYQLCAPSYL